MNKEKSRMIFFCKLLCLNIKRDISSVIIPKGINALLVKG